MKKRRVIGLLCASALLLSACQGGAEKGNNFNEINKNTIFKEESIDFALEEGDVTQIKIAGETLWVEQYFYDYGEEETVSQETEEGWSEDAARTAAVEVEETVVEEETLEEYAGPTVIQSITGFDMEGKVLSQWTRVLDINTGTGSMDVDENGNIYNIFYEYASYETDNIEDVTDKVFLESHLADGTEGIKIRLNGEEESYYYVNSLHCNKEGQIILDTSKGVEIYDEQGTPLKLIEKGASDESRLLEIRDDKFALFESSGDSAGIRVVDMKNGTLGDKESIPFNYYRYAVIDGKFYDLYLSDEYGIYGYNLGDAEITKIMDYISSDFNANNVHQSTLDFMDENTFFCVYYGENSEKIAKFGKVAPEDVVEKTELTLGCYYLDYSTKNKLMEFNKNSDKYRVNIMDYSMYDTMDDYTQGMTRMNTDIISGNVPDILVMSIDMPVNSYIGKGIFADLNTFLENDEDVKKEDLVPNVLEALSVSGGLYRISPYFEVNTFAAKTADVGKDAGWNMEKALAVLEGKPEGTQLFSEMTSSSFVSYTMAICGERYVDWAEGQCYFDSDEFKKVLEYAATLPRELDYSSMDENYWNEWEVQYRNGKTIVSPAYLSQFRDYTYMKQGTFGEDITLIGFPVDEGVGAGLNVGNTLSISALSKNQEAAWEFIKTFLTKEYQDSISYGFPLRISSLKKMEENAWNNPFYLDDEGNKVEYEDILSINGMDIVMEPLTKDETSEIMDYIMSLDKLCTYDNAINEIISEETESYFSGQKTVEDVSSVIQSRVKIYINENS